MDNSVAQQYQDVLDKVIDLLNVGGSLLITECSKEDGSSTDAVLCAVLDEGDTYRVFPFAVVVLDASTIYASPIPNVDEEHGHA